MTKIGPVSRSSTTASNSSLMTTSGSLPAVAIPAASARALTASGVARIDAGMLGQELGIGPSRPGRREVDGRLAPRADEPAAERLDRAADQGLGQVHHGVVVAIGLVGLEHRELGVVPRAEPLRCDKPARSRRPAPCRRPGAASSKLGGDPQEQVDVEGVVVGDERLRRGSPGDRLHRGRLDLDEPLLGHGLAE